MTLAKTEQEMSLLESVVVDGDLANLSSADRLSYYAKVCDSMGLNPLTKPFEYIRLNGKLILLRRQELHRPIGQDSQY